MWWLFGSWKDSVEERVCSETVSTVSGASREESKVKAISSREYGVAIAMRLRSRVGGIPLPLLSCHMCVFCPRQIAPGLKDTYRTGSDRWDGGGGGRDTVSEERESVYVCVCVRERERVCVRVRL